MNFINKSLLIFLSISSLFLSVYSHSSSDSLLFKSINSDYIEEKLRISGVIPKFINGTIYRNGFGKFEGHNFKFNHLFDSLSLILKFEIVGGNVYFQSRLLDTKYYNDSLDKIPLYRTLGGTHPPLNFKERIETKMHFMHDNLNANVIMINNKLFAVSDLAGDIVINKETLQYQEKYKFMNDQKLNFITSAHPEKWITNKNIIINYESDLERMMYKFYYIESYDDNHPMEKEYFANIPTNRFSYVHSFSLTESYIVFIEYPFFWDIEKIVDSVVILPSLKWDPNAKTKIHIINLYNTRNDIITIETEPFFSFHHINAFEYYNNVSNENESDGLSIFIELITYSDATIFDNFYMNNLLNNTNHNKIIKGGNYSKIIINIDKKHKISYFKMFTHKINTETIEMPVINPEYKGTFYKYFYAFTESGKLIKVDVISGDVMEWYEVDNIPSEPIFIPINNINNINEINNFYNFKTQKSAYLDIKDNNSCFNSFIKNNIYNSTDSEYTLKYEKYYQGYIKNYGTSKDEDNGVIVSVVLDTIRKISYLLFLDARTMTEIARADISTHIPLTCHGFFEPNQ